MTATYQTTENPYALKQVYGKDVCELMRRINALEYRTVPRGFTSWTLRSTDAPGDWYMCSTLDGARTYLISIIIIVYGSELFRYDIRVWAVDTSGSFPVLSWASGTLTDPDGYYERDRYPTTRPTFFTADGSGALWMGSRWCHDSRDPNNNTTNLIKVTRRSIPPPAETVVSWHNVSGANVLPVGAVPYYRELPDGLGYGLLGFWETGSGFRSRDGACFARPISGGGFELHSAGGITDALDGEHPIYKIEKYSAGGELVDFDVYSRPGATVWGNGEGATDDYFSFFEVTPDPYNDRWNGVGHSLVCKSALPKLDLSDDYAPPGSTNRGALIPPAPADAVVSTPTAHAFFGCVNASNQNFFLTQPGASWDSNVSAAPNSAIAKISSIQDPTTRAWTHTVRFIRRLGHLGPASRDTCGRDMATNAAGDVIGMVHWIEWNSQNDKDWRMARWRMSAWAEQTEWFAYGPDGVKVSLGTPDNGQSVPANNALVAAGALPAGEHIIDMRAACLRLIDDHFALVFREPRLEWVYDRIRGCFAAWDYWGKWAGKKTGQGTWPDYPLEEETVPPEVKPVLYVALALAHSEDRKYGLALEENIAQYDSNPSPEYRLGNAYYRFRKMTDEDMDHTPMHDVDIGEVRALVDLLEASYANAATFSGYSPNWIPWGNGDNEGCPFGG